MPSPRLTAILFMQDETPLVDPTFPDNALTCTRHC